MSVTFGINNGPVETWVGEEDSCYCHEDYQCPEYSCLCEQQKGYGWLCVNYWNRKVFTYLEEANAPPEDRHYKYCPVCSFCHGTGKRHYTEPKYEFNLSNSNFRGFAEMLQIPYDEDLCGTIEGGMLNTIYRNGMKLLNREDIVNRTLVRETIVEDNVIHCGKSADVWLTQIGYLVDMIKAARKMGKYIYFG